MIIICMQFPLSLSSTIFSIALPLALSHCTLMCIIELFPPQLQLQLHKHVLRIGHVPISYSNNVYKLWRVLRIGESCECSVNSSDNNNNNNEILSQLTSQMERTTTRSYSHTHTHTSIDRQSKHAHESLSRSQFRSLPGSLALTLLPHIRF